MAIDELSPLLKRLVQKDLASSYGPQLDVHTVTVKDGCLIVALTPEDHEHASARSGNQR